VTMKRASVPSRRPGAVRWQREQIATELMRGCTETSILFLSGLNRRGGRQIFGIDGSGLEL